MITKGLVIARYNENIDWTSDFEDFNLHIYNKGSILDDYNCKIIENKGREAHTYLTHIVENYHNLDDFTIFTQGNPFDHASVGEFKNLTNKQGYKTYVNYYANMVDGEIISRKQMPGSLWMNFKNRSEITPTTIYEIFYGKNIPNCWVPVCAIFSVDKETILNHSIDKYEQVLRLFERKDSDWLAYVLEYTWTLIFKSNGYSYSETNDSIV